jgi:DNA polymerase I-like protein with 3'-5' exonuclease and polymerase domains
MINISVKDAKKYIEKFFEQYKEVRIFFDEVILSAQKN